MRLALALAFAALLVPGTAAASTAVVTQTDRSENTLVYTAEDGEANQLQVHAAAASIVLTDPGADIDAGDGCAPAGPHAVTCSGDFPLAGVRAELGDADDSVVSDGPSLDVKGGEGHDELDASGTYGTLDGGPDDDVLTQGDEGGDLDGGPGPDELSGGDGRDSLTGGPGTDTIDGGGGLDLTKYMDHHAAVTVDLSDPGSPAGAKGEDDTVTNVEEVWGGHGDDVLTGRTAGGGLFGFDGDDTIVGGDGPDQINGGRGGDSIEGRGGADEIYGAGGRDTIDAGAGDDYVESSDDTFGAGPYRRDLVACGSGGDSVKPIESQLPVQPLPDVIDADCETVWTATGVPNIRRLHPTDGLEALKLKAACVARQRCLLRIAFHTGGRVAASAERQIRHGKVAKVTAPLDAEARERLEESGRLRLRLSMEVRWGRHLRNFQSGGYHVVLHRQP